IVLISNKAVYFKVNLSQDFDKNIHLFIYLIFGLRISSSLKTLRIFSSQKKLHEQITRDFIHQPNTQFFLNIQSLKN
ncbi:hypothetical protein BpHYR1_037421, partial [Brachionus plicatilis]